MVIGDPDVRARVSALYRESFAVYAATPAAGGSPTTEQRRDDVRSSAQYLADTMHRAPYLLTRSPKGGPSG